MVKPSREKPLGDNDLIDGDFFALSRPVIDRIKDDNTSCWAEPLETLARDAQLAACRQAGSWPRMDTWHGRVSVSRAVRHGGAGSGQ